MTKEDIKMDLTTLNLTAAEEKLIKNSATFRTDIPFILIIIFAAVYIWVKHYNLFRENIFFAVYNAIFYLGLIWAVLRIYWYRKKFSSLILKLITIINTKK